MAKLDSKVVMYALLSVLLLQLSGQVGGVDVTFYVNANGCSGAGVQCVNLQLSQCCYITDGGGTQTGSVQTSNTGSSVTSIVYNDGQCKNTQNLGFGDTCYPGQYTGAIWTNTPVRRSLLGEIEVAACDTQMKANAVVFTEDSTKGQWVLPSSDTEELYSQMQNVPDVEKTNWLRSRGATYNEL